MDIFFNASISGKKEFERNYQLIIDTIQDLGHKVASPLLRPKTVDDVSRESSEEAEAYYEKLRRWLSSSEICVFETSFPSTGIGHEVTLSLNFNKPVIALHIKDKPPYILEVVPAAGLQVLEYSADDLKRILSPAILIASEKVDTRFNFFIPRRLVTYLNWISKKRRIPRAVYLRQLIRDQMRRHEAHRTEW